MVNNSFVDQFHQILFIGFSSHLIDKFCIPVPSADAKKSSPPEHGLPCIIRLHVSQVFQVTRKKLLVEFNIRSVFKIPFINITLYHYIRIQFWQLFCKQSHGFPNNLRSSWIIPGLRQKHTLCIFSGLDIDLHCSGAVKNLNECLNPFRFPVHIPGIRKVIQDIELFQIAFKSAFITGIAFL